MRTRPLRQYDLSFRHRSGVAFQVTTTGETPCEAKNEGWCQLEDAKRASSDTYPSDNDWALVYVSPGTLVEESE